MQVLLYADDIVLFAETPAALRRILKEFAALLQEDLGLTVSLDSRKSCWSTCLPWRRKEAAASFMNWGAGAMLYRKPSDGLPLLGGMWRVDGRSDTEVEHRVQAMRRATWATRPWWQV